MVIHNSLHTSSKGFCASGVCNTDYHQRNTLSQMAGMNLVSNLPNVLYMIILHQPNGSLNTNAAVRAILQYRNTIMPEINLSPQILFHGSFVTIFLLKPCWYHLHKYWIISSKQREDYSHRQNQQTRERYDSPVTPENPALEVGTSVAPTRRY